MNQAPNRFWEKVRRDPNGCWVWTAAINANGYGAFWNDGRMVRAHRFSFEQANGPIPDGHVVMHECDNRACVNPAHLKSGTDADNAQDKIKKGRHARGELSASAKLTTLQAIAIRFSDGNHAVIAERFGVSRSAVGLIKRGKRYAHIKEGDVMRYYAAREVRGSDGEGTGVWRFTVKHDNAIYPVGYCANECEGHPTPEEAQAHYKSYLLDNNLTLDGVTTTGHFNCQAQGCDDLTNKKASIVGHPGSWHLCDQHRKRDVVEDLFNPIEFWQS